VNKALKSHICILILFVSQLCIGQDTTKKITLRSYLQQIERSYSVKFAFADATIKDLSIKPAERPLELEELLQYLSLQTGLSFNKLDERFISIELEKDSSYSTATLQVLDEIFIENFLTEGISESFDGSYTFNPKSYGLIPGMIEPDLLQAVLALPGVQSADERVSNLNIRGGTNDENLILFEGIRMYQSGHFFGLISAFNPYLTEEVITRKNGTPSKYGEGVSGLLNIENSNKVPTRLSGGAGVNFLAADAFVNAPLSKKIALQFSARRSITDLLDTPTYEAYFQRIFEDSELNNTSREASIEFADETFFFNDFNAKLIYNINDNHKFRANFISIYNMLDYGERTTNEGLGSLENQSSLKQSSLAGSLEYEANWSNTFKSLLQLTVSSYELDAVSSNITDNQTLIQENKVLDLGLRIDNILQINSKWRSNFGYQLIEVGVNNLEDVSQPRFRSSITEVILTHSVYGDVRYESPNKATIINLGLRTNYMDKLETFLVEPRVNFSQEVLTNLRLEVQGEFKSQSLTQIIDLQQDFLGIEKRRWQLANGYNVPLVQSKQGGLGFSYSNRGWLAEVDAYWKKVEGISSRTQGFQNQFQFVEDIGSYSIAGVELLLNKQFRQFSTWFSYTFSENNYEFESIFDGVAFPNNLDITHNLNASFVYIGNNIKAGLGLNWNSGRPFTAVSSQQDIGNTTIEFDLPNNERLPEYLRVDVSANYSIEFSPSIKGELGLSLWNITDSENLVNRFYILDNENQIIEVNNTGLGFTPNFSFRVFF
jgi:hypothetical protein